MRNFWATLYLYLQVLLLVHIIVDFRLYIHWIHRVILIIILLASVAFTICIAILWPNGFGLMRLSLTVNHIELFCITPLTFRLLKFRDLNFSTSYYSALFEILQYSVTFETLLNIIVKIVVV